MGLLGRIKRLKTRLRYAFKSNFDVLSQAEPYSNGLAFGKRWQASKAPPHPPDSYHSNPLRRFFAARKEGRGIWKWDHYFDIYDRHFGRFRGQEVHVLEIGIYSGGSLDMWREYFGPKAHIYGIDIEPACRAYEADRVKVFIGDQADREFWKSFRAQVPTLDIAIDDGGHLPEQQRISLEELLPHLQSGGVYACEDVHQTLNPYATFVHGLSHPLNNFDGKTEDHADPERRLVVPANPLQASIEGIYLYPFVTVLERKAWWMPHLVCPKHGTQWEPFLT